MRIHESLDDLGPYCLIPLTRGKHTMVSPEDVEFTSSVTWLYHWKARPGYIGYAVRRYPFGAFMHRLLIGAAPNLEVDHINGNSLDNRRGNLRTATDLQQAWNRKVYRNNVSGFKGVCHEIHRGSFRARIRANGRLLHLGRYDTGEDAARAYDAAARELFGEYARLNFPNEADRRSVATPAGRNLTTV